MTSRLIALAALLYFSIGSWSSLGAQEPVPGIGSLIAVSANAPATVLAQADWWPDYPQAGGEHDIQRGPGGYFSYIKLILIVLVFLLWVKLTDWMNRDALQFGEHIGQSAEIWNPIVVLAFVGGLAAVLCIPQFLAGFPVYAALALLPWTIYMLQRKGQIPDEARTGELFAENITVAALPITIKAAGSSKEDSQSRLIRARQSAQFEPVGQLLHDSLLKRVEQILLDYTKDHVAHRIQVDGLWHQSPPMDRETGDGMLWVLKTLAGLNPAERRQQQKGAFEAKLNRETVELELTSQGVQTGERVLIKVRREQVLKLELSELGMPAPMRDTLLDKLGSAGMVIISAPPGQGLTATWEAVLNAADRFTRDFVGIADFDDRETERENIEITYIDSRQGQTPADLLRGMVLKQPDAFVMSKITDLKTMDIMTDQGANENRTVVTRVQANSAAEALLRMLAIAGNREQFASSVTAVTCQRLVRGLCDKCKRPIQANPQAIQQMGGNPAVHQVLYKSYQLPPVEQRVDEQGKPVHMEPCAACGGIGFVGRTAIYELLIVDQAIRKALVKSPRLEVINQVARQQGNRNLLQQAYQAVLEGRTSLPEVQRVFQVRK